MLGRLCGPKAQDNGDKQFRIHNTEEGRDFEIRDDPGEFVSIPVPCLRSSRAAKTCQKSVSDRYYGSLSSPSTPPVNRETCKHLCQ